MIEYVENNWAVCNACLRSEKDDDVKTIHICPATSGVGGMRIMLCKHCRNELNSLLAVDKSSVNSNR